MKKTIILSISLWSMLSLHGATKEKIIADFDSGKKPSNLGTDMGSWDINPDDNTQTCVEEFSDKVKVGNKGYSWRIDYDVDSQNPAFNGVWIKLEKINIASWDYLTFQIKGDEKNGFTSRLKIDLKSGSQSGYHYVTGITDKWRKIRIPLSAFNIGAMKTIDELIFVFEDNSVTKKTGTIYIDNIILEKKRNNNKK